MNEPSLPWHRALAYALTGEDHPDLGTQDRPEPTELAALLADPADRSDWRAAVAARRAAGLSWPYPVPAELSNGLGAAQFASALTDVRAQLGLLGSVPRVAQSRPLDVAEQRLLRDVPPHHGS